MNQPRSRKKTDEETDEQDWLNAFGGFLGASLTEPYDVEAWCNMLLCIINNKKLWHLIPATVQCAYNFNEERFLHKFHSLMISRMGVSKNSEQFLSIVTEEAVKAKQITDDMINLRPVNVDGKEFLRGEMK